MGKAREFWISFEGNPDFDRKGHMRFVSGEKIAPIDHSEEVIHVREVLPEEPMQGDGAKDFEWHWKYQQGALFLKEENSSKEWRKSLAEYFFRMGQENARANSKSERVMRDALEVIAKVSAYDGNAAREVAKQALKLAKKGE